MELSQERLPSEVVRSPDTTTIWPAVPQHTPEKTPSQGDITLPDLKTVLSPEFERRPSSQDSALALGSPKSIRSLPRIDPGYANITDTRRAGDTAMVSPLGTTSAMSGEDRAVRSTSVVSMDDPDVRIAAEALSGLGNPAGELNDARNAWMERVDLTSCQLLPALPEAQACTCHHMRALPWVQPLRTTSLYLS